MLKENEKNYILLLFAILIALKSMS